MAVDEYPLLDTSELDLLVASYSDTQRSISPAALLDTTLDGFTVEEELLGMIRNTVLRNFAGLAVIASANFALGLKEEDQSEPSIIAVGNECNFAGWIAGLTICNFTKAALKAEMTTDTAEPIVLPGLVIRTDPVLEEFSDSSGNISLMPYCAVLPGSAYQLRRITNATLR